MFGPIVITALSLATVVAVGNVLWGWWKYSDERAQGVRAAEAQSQVMAEQMQHLRYRHPEIVKTSRLDRHDTYVWIHVGLWLYGWGVLLSPGPNSYLTTMNWGAQQSLGLCMLVGSTLGLIGTTLGLRVGRFRVAARVSKNLVSDLLGDDIRIPYALGGFGLLSLSVSMWFYAGAIFVASEDKVLGFLSGALSTCVGLMCITLGVRFVLRVRTYARSRNNLIAEALSRLS